MNLVVIGATGGLGSQVVAQAFAAGHIVTTIVRRPAVVTLQPQSVLTAFRCSASERDKVEFLEDLS